MRQGFIAISIVTFYCTIDNFQVGEGDIHE